MVYDHIRYRLQTAAFNWPASDLMVTAWSGVPTFVPTDEVIADLVAHGPAERGSSLTITSRTVAADGSAQTNQVVIPGVVPGDPVTFLTMSIRKPTHPQSELVLFLDEIDGLPFDPNGLDMLIQPDILTQRGWWKA